MREMSSASLARGVSPFAALQRSALFEGLGPDQLNAVARLMEPRSFETGDVLCRAGERGETMFILVDGLVHVHSASSDEEPRVVAKLRRGDVVGATALVTEEPRTANVLAGMPTDALELRKADLDDLVERFPRILVNMSRILSRRLVRSNLRAAHAAERGEAVGLIVARSLMPAVPAILSATAAASPRAIESLDTRTGFDQAVGSLDVLLDSHDTVVVVARAEGGSAPLLLDHVDRAILLVEDEGQAQRFARPGERALGRERIEIVFVGGSGRRRTATSASEPLPVVRVIEPHGGNGSPTLPARDVAWLGRHISRTKLGLALGAGGAKGYAHVGALRVLQDSGYSIDFVAGSSIGAIVASYLALGRDAAEIDRTLRRTFTEDTVAEIFKLSLSGTSTGLETMKRILRETTDDGTFEDALIPLVVMAVDLTERNPAPIREGPLWEALLAATALAGMFPPYRRDGHRLVDGLALVPVPTRSVKEDGADVTIAVNLMSRETLPAWPGEPPPPPPSKQRASRMLDTLLEVMDLMQLDTSVRHAETADVVITPRFGPGSWRDFHLADLFLGAGHQAAEEQLSVLKGLARPQFASVHN
jgi:NTE family protein